MVEYYHELISSPKREPSTSAEEISKLECFSTRLLVIALKKSWKLRKERKGKSEDDTTQGESYQSIMARFQKEISDADVPQEERQKLYVQKVKEQNQKLRELMMKRKIARVIRVYNHTSVEEVQYALEVCGNDEENVIRVFGHPIFLLEVRKRVAQKAAGLTPEPMPHFLVPTADEAMPGPPGSDSDTDSAYSGRHVETSSSEGEDFEAVRQPRQRRRRGGSTSPSGPKVRAPRLLLDEALRTKEKTNSQAGWSEARKKAFTKIKENPNMYYYRFNAPEEKQSTGGWTAEEKDRFFQRLLQLGGIDYHWGIFSMEIPGRVGYQCSNFYRYLIKEGEVYDRNYRRQGKDFVFMKKLGHGARGRLEHRNAHMPKILRGKYRNVELSEVPKFLKLQTAPPPDVIEEVAAAARPVSPPSVKKKKPKTPKAKLSRGGDKNDKTFSGSRSPSTFFEPQDKLDWTALLGFTDYLTQEDLEKPAMTKDGYVMSMRSWTKCLQGHETTNRNRCPFTRKPLTRRSLTLLTAHNVDSLRDNIRNQPDDAVIADTERIKRAREECALVVERQRLADKKAVAAVVEPSPKKQKTEDAAANGSE